MNDEVLTEPRLYFRLVTGQEIRSIRQLIEIVPTLEEEQYRHHVNEWKNDFYNWITGVFQDAEVADLIRSCGTRDEFQEKLFEYLLEEKRKAQKKVKETFRETQKEVFKRDPTRFKQFREQESRHQERVSDQFAEAAQRFAETRKESVLPQTIHKLDAMQERLKELRQYITATRKEGNDPLLAELALRVFTAKMNYARLTQEEGDFDRVETILNEAEKELEEVVMTKRVDAVKEVELLVKIAQEKERGTTKGSASEKFAAAKARIGAAPAKGAAPPSPDGSSDRQNRRGSDAAQPMNEASPAGDESGSKMGVLPGKVSA